jgi:hypothetical protein
VFYPAPMSKDSIIKAHVGYCFWPGRKFPSWFKFSIQNIFIIFNARMTALDAAFINERC